MSSKSPFSASAASAAAGPTSTPFAPESASAFTGGSLFGGYELVARIGVGGMGEAFLASASAPRGRDRFRKLCVLKRLHPQLAREAHSRSRFAQEARIAARLNHPNVVQTYDAGEVDGIPYLAMEFLEGQTLRSFTIACAATGILPDALFWLRIVSDALAGLEHLHALRDFDGTPLGVVHRDVSPHNIFVTYSGRVALIDFGMLKLVSGEKPSLCHTLAGKPRYMAPEYVASGAVDRRADIFSMGVVLWEALAGRVMPHADITPRGSCVPRPTLGAVGVAVDDALEAIVARALSINPASRFATAREMREAIESYIDEAGPAPCREDVGEMLTSYFVEERERMQKLVARQMGDMHTRLKAAVEADAAGEFPSGRWNLVRRANVSEDSRVQVFPLPTVRGIDSVLEVDDGDILVGDYDADDGDDDRMNDEVPPSHQRARAFRDVLPL